jgi:carboxylesterase
VTIPDRSFAIEAGRIGFLLIHGLGGTPNEHRFIAAGLARHGYTVHCPQLAGHCGSYENLRATGWKDWYASSEAA